MASRQMGFAPAAPLWSQQTELPIRSRQAEEVGAGGIAALAQAVALAGGAEAAADEVGDGAAALHAAAEVGVVEAAFAALADEGEDAGGPVGVVLDEPGFDEVLHLEREADEDGAGAGSTGGRGGGDDCLDLVVGEAGDHGRDVDADRDAALGQGFHGAQAAAGGGGAGLHATGELGVEGGDRKVDADELVAGEVLEQVEVAHHPGGLGDDADRVTRLGQDLEDGAGGAQAALNGLVGIGVGTKRDRAGAVVGAGQLGTEEGCGVRLDEDAGLEVEAGGEAPVGVAGSGVAVDSAVLAPPIGVDRLGEGDVGRGVAGNQTAGGVGDQLGAGRRGIGQLVEGAPAIVEGLAARGLEAVRGVEGGTAALMRPGEQRSSPERNVNIVAVDSPLSSPGLGSARSLEKVEHADGTLRHLALADHGRPDHGKAGGPREPVAGWWHGLVGREPAA